MKRLLACVLLLVCLCSVSFPAGKIFAANSEPAPYTLCNHAHWDTIGPILLRIETVTNANGTKTYTEYSCKEYRCSECGYTYEGPEYISKQYTV